jgi:predicted PurR-regulated permease PerM
MFFLLSLLIIYGGDIIIPLCYGALLAVLLLPVVHFLERRKIGKVMSIIISLLLATAFISGIFYFLASQIMNFSDDIPKIKQQLNEHYKTLQVWVREHFNMTIREQHKLLDQATDKISDEGGGYIGDTFFSITKFLMVVILLPVYAFLFLYYRNMLKNFLLDVVPDKDEYKMLDVLEESKVILQNYMVGLIIEMAIVATINIGGFLLIGLKYAVFLGLLAAILNLIPYVGMLIAAIFCMVVTLTSSNQLSDVIWTGVVLTVVQFIDNNFIMPKVVGNKVKVNALVTIIGVLIGGALSGISGMFLSIPVIAILKSIFERIKPLAPWGMLLSDQSEDKKSS